MATPITPAEQELDKLLAPAEAGSIEQTIKVHPDQSLLSDTKTKGVEHRALLGNIISRTKVWVKALYEKQNYSGPHRTGTVSIGDVHWTLTTTEITLWRALADFNASAAPAEGAEWTAFAVLPVTVSEQDLSDIEQRILDLEGAMASDDVNLDTIQEIVTYIKTNRSNIQLLGTVVDDLILFADELDARLLLAEQAITALQQVVASNDPNLNTIQKIVNYIKSTTPGTTGSVGFTPTWIVRPRMTVDASFNIVVLNQEPDLPTADWGDYNIVADTGDNGIIFPAVTPPATGVERIDTVDLGPTGYYHHTKGEESSVGAVAAPALLNNRLRACYIHWNGSTGTVTQPEGSGYWGGMSKSSTDATTIEEYFNSLIPEALTVQPNKLLGRHPDEVAGPIQEVSPGAGIVMDNDGFLHMGYRAGSGDTFEGRIYSPANSVLSTATDLNQGYISIPIPFTAPDFNVNMKLNLRASYPAADSSRVISIADIHIVGYVSPAGVWQDGNVLITSDSLERDIPVRFVKTTAGGYRLYLGEATTMWGILYVGVEVVAFARSGSTLELAKAGWTPSVAQAIDGTAQLTISNNLTYAKGTGAGTGTETGGATFTAITANQHGTHPAFTTQHDFNVWVLQNAYFK